MVDAQPIVSTLSRARRATDIKKARRPLEEIVRAVLVACGMISIFTTLGIVMVLGGEALKFFQSPEVTLTEFFTSHALGP